MPSESGVHVVNGVDELPLVVVQYFPDGRLTQLPLICRSLTPQTVQLPEDQ